MGIGVGIRGDSARVARGLVVDPAASVVGPGGGGAGGEGGGSRLNVAVTDLSASIVIMQRRGSNCGPAQAPPQPPKVDSVDGWAERVTVVPLVSCTEQLVTHSSVGGRMVTVPLPSPVTVNVRVKGGGGGEAGERGEPPHPANTSSKRMLLTIHLYAAIAQGRPHNEVAARRVCGFPSACLLAPLTASTVGLTRRGGHRRRG